MFHKEGYTIIFITLLVLGMGVITAGELISSYTAQKIIQIALFVLTVLVLQFFRNPNRTTVLNDKNIIAPVDGEIVAIEEVEEGEYFKAKRRQISIFMTPLNVHVTRYPISGKVVFSKYHKGKYLIASHPKASTENERTTIVVNNKSVGDILYRQVAGAVARRIVNYAKEGETAVQGEDAGFIKFGSRADIFVPLDFEIKVTIGEKVRGGEQVIAVNNS
jgi:phosphatidylserine decarboxylase